MHKVLEVKVLQGSHTVEPLVDSCYQGVERQKSSDHGSDQERSVPEDEKTSVKRATLNPTWNETIRFPIANIYEKPVEACCFAVQSQLTAANQVLRVDVYDEDLVPDTIKQGDDLMGSFEIPFDEKLPMGNVTQGWCEKTSFALEEEVSNNTNKQPPAIELEIRVVEENIHRKDSTRSFRMRTRRSKGDELFGT
eukprot:756649-Hanusia_phi.AAC.1